MIPTLPTLSKSLLISAAGMEVQTQRLLRISENLANVNTKAQEPGGMPYQRKTIIFTNRIDPKTGVERVVVKKISKDNSPFREVYDPEDPIANQDGIVHMPNVNPLTEMLDMREANLTHEANLRAYEKTLKMMEETLTLLRN